MIKHIWNLFKNKQSLWVEWVHKNLLKNRSFWSIQMPSTPTWTWRKLLQGRNWCKDWIKMQVGDGRSTHLWHDNWLPTGQRAIDIYSARVLSTTGLSWNARVVDIIVRDQWCFPPGSTCIQNLWHNINFYPNSLDPDTPIWTLSSSGEFNIQSAWDQMRARKPYNKLSPIIWHPLHVPRQSIILWLATKGRLRTKDRLPRTAENDNTCNLCRREGESHDHLFFNCGYSKKVWELITTKAKIAWPMLPWQDLLTWLEQRTTVTGNFLQWISYLALSSTIYHLWRERNRRTFDNSGQSTNTLCDDILVQIRTQLMEHTRKEDIPDLHQRIWNLRD